MTHQDWRGEPVEIPWPHLTQKQAAKELGVSVEYLQGLANNPIPAVKVSTNKGGQIWLFQREAVTAIKQRLPKQEAEE